jgi:sugar O-acyltransferase (sialic acid O-acetyltransferase NeuD family)
VSVKKGRLLIVGASGHGRVVADCAASLDRWTEIIFFDDRHPGIDHNFKWPIRGSTASLPGAAGPGDEAFVAIGNCATRVTLLMRFQSMNLRLATLIHPAASVSADTKIECGSIVVAGAVVNIGATVGLGGIINTGSSVDHDCILDSGVHVCPGARLAGDVRVGERSWIGIGAVVRQGIQIGADVVVGAGAAVMTDISDGLTVVGVPARPLDTRPDNKGS